MKLNRKGTSFGIMSIAEQNQLFQKWIENGEVLVKSESKGTRWRIEKNPQWQTHVKYWCKEWNVVTGVELVGLLCMVSNKTDIKASYNFTTCVLIAQYLNTKYYDNNGNSWDNARQMKLSEIKDIIDVDCDVL